MSAIEPILLTTTRILTFMGQRALTNATGFYFKRAERLFLVTSKHVVIDEASNHLPDRIEIELHTDIGNLVRCTSYSIPLYHKGRSVWRQGEDSAGDIDVAVIELQRSVLPASMVYAAFTADHLADQIDQVEVGRALLVVGYPLGFQDTLHHMPVVRQAIVASAYGLRFQGEGFFLTDARTHRGTSGAPVVTRIAQPDASCRELPWQLLGVHSARLDIGTRDLNLDEALGLNCAWYADILLTLTES